MFFKLPPRGFEYGTVSIAWRPDATLEPFDLEDVAELGMALVLKDQLKRAADEKRMLGVQA